MSPPSLENQKGGLGASERKITVSVLTYGGANAADYIHGDSLVWRITFLRKSFICGIQNDARLCARLRRPNRFFNSLHD